MKLVIAILKDADSDAVIQALTSAQFRVTRIASTGGLLRRGVATLLVGVEDEKVDAAIDVVRASTPEPPPNEKRATIFVVDVARHIQV